VGPRYNCTVCHDFDLCSKCEATAVHPPEHPLLKYRQPENSPVVHHGITCDGCQTSPITGIRFKCRVCSDYDLCESCEAKNVHPADHPLIKFKVEKTRHGHHGHGGHGHHGFGGRLQFPHPFHKILHDAFRGRVHDTFRGRMFEHGLFGGENWPSWRGHGCHRRWLTRGSVGDAVKEIQKALKIEVDGFFGGKTEQAVKEFQAANGLDVDGIVGRRTRAKLMGEESDSEEKECRRRSWLARGSTGDAVKELQQALGIQADGFFGPKTEQAVKEFQTAHSLPVDGIVGPRTRAALAPAEKTQAPPTAALELLTSMGFSDANLNARLLQKHKGDVDQVIAELLGA